MTDTTLDATGLLSLNIKLLGGFYLTYDTTPITTLNSGRSHALFVYLLLHRHDLQPRQHLAFQFWPDATDRQARTNLRLALHRLKQHLPKANQFIYADTNSIGWQTDASYTLDVEVFQSTIGQAKAAQHNHNDALLCDALKHATQLYRGDLLTHTSMPCIDDDWLLLERERLRQQAIWAFETLVDLLTQTRDTQGAIAQAQALIRLDPLCESGYQRLMELHDRMGDRATALRIYHQCLEILRDQLGIDPSPETQRLYHRFLNAETTAETADSSNALQESNGNLRQRSSQEPAYIGTVQPAVPLANPPVANPSDWFDHSDKMSIQRTPHPNHQTALSQSIPLIGRDREWASIQQWFQKEEHQSRPVLLLTGESGIGKTRMLEEIRTTTIAAGRTVLWGRAFEAETLRPYGAWIDALRGYLATSRASLTIPPDLSVLLPECTSDSHSLLPGDRSRLFDAVVQVLAQGCSDGRPMVILLDDIQWLDEASSALLHYVSRLMRSLPVWIACAARSQELARPQELNNGAIAQVIQTLRRDQRLDTISLEPLAHEDIVRLIQEVNADQRLDASVANPVFTGSGGNPLYALEIARAKVSNAAAPESTSNHLEVLIHDRLNSLSQTARDLLPWAAALGFSFPPSLLTHLTQLPPMQAMTVMEELETQGILRPSMTQEGESRYDFSHDVVRKVAYQQLSAPRQQMMHRHIAQRLQEYANAQPAWINDVAFHAEKGGEDHLAATAFLNAAQRSLQLFAYTEADQLAQRGIHHSQALGDRERIQIHLACLNVIVLTGVSSDRVTQIEQELQSLIMAARHHHLNDEEARGLEILLVLNYSHENVSTVHHHALAVAETLSLTTPFTTARMLAYGGSCLAEIKRDLSRAEAMLAEAQTLAARMQLSISDIPGGLACIRNHFGNWDESRSLMKQAWQMAQLDHDHWRECAWLKFLIQFELEAGNFEAALHASQDMIEVTSKMGGEGSEEAFAIALQMLTRYHLQPQPNARSLDSAIVKLRELDTKRMLAYIQHSAAEVDLKHHQVERAIVRASEAYTAAQAVDDRCESVLALSVLARGAIAQSRHQQAVEFIKELHALDTDALSVRAQSAIQRVQESADSYRND